MASVISTGRRFFHQFSPRYTRMSIRLIHPEIIGCAKEAVRGFSNCKTSSIPKCFLAPKFVSLLNTGFSSSGNFSQSCETYDYHKICDETLDSLCEYFEDLLENSPHLTAADVTYGDGVLTVNFGNSHGTYVINRQTPNKQIWLSSPTSGPKRYDFEPSQNSWVYKHSKESLHQLLQSEVSKIVEQSSSPVNFFQCSYSGRNTK